MKVKKNGREEELFKPKIIRTTVALKMRIVHILLTITSKELFTE